MALPDHARDAARGFARHVPAEIPVKGGRVRVFLGSLAGGTSPVHTFTPLLGAEVVLEARAEVALEVDASFEHGVLVDDGTIRLEGVEVAPAGLGYVAPGTPRLLLGNVTEHAARVVVLGGVPFEEEIVMWWNFVGRSHAEIVAFREDWEQRSERFGYVEGYGGQPQRLPAPALPTTRLKPRLSPPGSGDRSAWG